MIDDPMIDDRIATGISKRLVTSVEELIVYQRAYAVSLTIHRKSLEFPKIEQYALADQIRRASKSICANLSEGFARQGHSSAEFGRFISMSLGSAGEMQTWINYCKDLGYIAPELASEWIEGYQSILKMLQKLKSRIT